MSQLEVVRTFLRALEEADLDRAAPLCDVDFALQVPGGQMLGWRELGRAIWGLHAAMPDLRWEILEAREDPGFVTGTLAASGTHVHDLDLQIFDVPVVPASGRRIQLPPEPFEVALQRGRIRRFGWPSSAEGAQGLLAPAFALGVDVQPAGIMG